MDNVDEEEHSIALKLDGSFYDVMRR